jgi:hypothetical protein
MTKLSKAAKETQRKTDRLVQGKGHSPKQKVATDYNFAIMQLAGALAVLKGPKVIEAILVTPVGTSTRTERALCISHLESVIADLKVGTTENLKELYKLHGLGK